MKDLSLKAFIIVILTRISESVVQIYDEFCPLLLNQFKSREYVQFETFDACLDEFYSKIESQRSEQQQKAKESSATQRLNKIRVDQVWYFFYTHTFCFSKRGSSQL